MLHLVKPAIEYKQQIAAFRQEFIAFGGDHDGMGSLVRLKTVEEWLQQVEDCSREETCPSHWVPMTQFLCIRDEDKKMVGAIQVRHRFNEFLEKYAGHIGYSVCHSERRKGYATQMLHHILPYCKKIRLHRILVCCLEGNEGSRKTILNNGGVYERTVHEPEGNVMLERYWITLS